MASITPTSPTRSSKQKSKFEGRKPAMLTIPLKTSAPVTETGVLSTKASAPVSPRVLEFSNDVGRNNEDFMSFDKMIAEGQKREKQFNTEIPQSPLSAKDVESISGSEKKGDGLTSFNDTIQHYLKSKEQAKPQPDSLVRKTLTGLLQEDSTQKADEISKINRSSTI